MDDGRDELDDATDAVKVRVSVEMSWMKWFSRETDERTNTHTYTEIDRQAG